MEWHTKSRIRRPGIIEPCIPTRATKPPVGPQWIHEIKHDGYRLIGRKRDGRVRLFTRNGFDWTDRYPLICAAVAALRTASAVIDGEAVWCDGTGLAIFDKLHSRAYDEHVILYAFDLLELDGEDWRPRPLEERKARFAKLLAKAPAGIHYSEHIEGDGAAIFAHACKLGAEGIVSKHREHPYRAGPPRALAMISRNAAASRRALSADRLPPSIAGRSARPVANSVRSSPESRTISVEAFSSAGAARPLVA
jgi:bifunctional non-homologous end joining protein LigD